MEGHLGFGYSSLVAQGFSEVVDIELRLESNFSCGHEYVEDRESRMKLLKANVSQGGF